MCQRLPQLLACLTLTGCLKSFSMGQLLHYIMSVHRIELLMTLNAIHRILTVHAIRRPWITDIDIPTLTALKTNGANVCYPRLQQCIVKTLGKHTKCFSSKENDEISSLSLTDPMNVKSNLNFTFQVSTYSWVNDWVLQPALQKYNKNIAAHFLGRLFASL